MGKEGNSNCGGEKEIQIREQRGEARKERVGTDERVKEIAVTK